MEDGLYYSYSDECKQNFMTNKLKTMNKCTDFEYYSISSVIFEADYYKDSFENTWKSLRTKYNICSTECLHFAEYKKLFSKKHIDNIQNYFNAEQHLTNYSRANIFLTLSGNEITLDQALKQVKTHLTIRDSDISAYKTFYLDDQDDSISRKNLKGFFLELKKILESSIFSIINTDYIIKKKKYVIKGKKDEVVFSKPTSVIPNNIAKSAARITFKKQLDLIIEYLLSTDVNGNLYLNQNMTNKRYIKLRFDADGKNFDEKTNLKMAFNEALTVGTERFLQETSAKLLDEIRFIRKEEVGSEYSPPHCGGELVDFICSMICTITRFETLKDKHYLSDDEMDINDYTTFKFIDYEEEDNDGVNFYEVLKNNLFLQSKLNFF